jgi:hypothetical protein
LGEICNDWIVASAMPPHKNAHAALIAPNKLGLGFSIACADASDEIRRCVCPGDRIVLPP